MGLAIGNCPWIELCADSSDPVTYDEVDWPSKSWTGGGYAAFMPPGVSTSYGKALSAPVGRIHWAGTEMADRWPGFFDGAVRTGEAAAAAIHTLLGGGDG